MTNDIRLSGRQWGADGMWRHDELPARFVVIRGQLCLDEEQRMLLLAALLEHVGTMRAVQLGRIEPWLRAIALCKESEGV